jgi:hypothetical protein
MAGDDAYRDELQLALAESASLVRRLRGVAGSSWRRRREGVLAALGNLAELVARTEGSEPHRLPVVEDHALGDAAAVILGDVLDELGRRPDAVLLKQVRLALADLCRAAG